MTRGFAVVLTILMLGAAYFTAWYGTQRRDYFPAYLQTTYADCDVWQGIIERLPVMNDFDVEWFSGELSAFNEPSLFRPDDPLARTIRFTWLRSFDDPVVVRIDALPDGRQRMTAKQRPGGVGFSPTGGIARDREIVRILTVDEAEGLNSVLASTQFFSAEPSGCWGGVDGANWILEGHNPGQGYQYRYKWAAESGLEYDLGIFLLGLTGWNVEPIY